MGAARQDLRIQVWPDFNKSELVFDATSSYTQLSFSTGVHGGFRDLRLAAPMPYREAREALNRANLKGWHFYHIEVNEGDRLVWEGRIMNVVTRSGRNFEGVSLTALGYWSACRDQYYSASDAGNTNWTTSGPHTSDKIIKELLTKVCPAINSDQADIDTNSRNIVGIVLTARQYPQDILIDKLAPLADTGLIPWYFAIWEDRKPWWKQRSVATVDWFVPTQSMPDFGIGQQAVHLRNRIIPEKNGVEGTAASDTTYSTVRELLVTIPTGAPTNAENDMRDTALAEKKLPRQDQDLVIDGPIFTSKAAGHLASVDGSMVEAPRWRVRAGQVVRVQGLDTKSGAPELDDRTTFYIVETVYDAIKDELSVVTDRPKADIATLLARRIQLELDR